MEHKSINTGIRGNNVEYKLEVSKEQFDMAAKKLLGNIKMELDQTDQYFDVKTGYCKMRTEVWKRAYFPRVILDFVIECPRLGLAHEYFIRYYRDLSVSPSESRYKRYLISTGESDIAEMLSVFAVDCLVTKHRIVYIKGHTRIHLDCIEELPNRWFIEFEYVVDDFLKNDFMDSETRGVIEIMRYVEELGLKDAKVLTCSYYDLVK